MIRHARALLLRCVLALPALLAALMLPLPAAAQQRYPAEVVKFIIPFPPGAATDVLARILIQELQATTGGTFVADNRTGALGIIGVTALSRAAPNGYTIGLSSISTHSTAAFMFRNLPYDALKNFEHISRLGLYSWILVSDPSHGFKSPADLVKAAKANPGKFNFAYGSAAAQVGGSAFNKLFGIEAVGVSYKGQPQALIDVSGKLITYMMVDVGAAGPFVNSGKVTALAMAASRRSAFMPALPTFEEQGLPGFELLGWVGLSAPAGTPRPIVEQLSATVQKILARQEVVDKFKAAGAEAAHLPTEGFRDFVARQQSLWGTRITEAGIKPEEL